jgi:hypothetical protein
MNIIDTLNAKIDLNRASDDEVARIVGMTVEEFDADTTAPDPTDTNDVFNRFCTAWGITSDRLLFHQYANQCHVGQWTWGALGTIWMEFNKWGREALIAQQDAADEQRTMAVACDRWTDGEGIRHDPNFDAYI